MTAVKLVRAERRERDEFAVLARMGEIREKIERRAVRPVKVLDDEERWASEVEATEDAEKRFEQPRLRRISTDTVLHVRLDPLAELREQSPELGRRGPEELAQRVGRDAPRDAPQRLHDRRERQAGTAEFDASANQHRPLLLARPPDHL